MARTKKILTLFCLFNIALLIMPHVTSAEESSVPSVTALKEKPTPKANNVTDVISSPAFMSENFTETHPILRLTPDKSDLINLEAEAASVIVGNPNHVNVLLDTPNVLVVVPRNPGASHFTVIGKDGKVLMQRHVIVASPKEDYVRIRRSCANSSVGSNCQETSVYFCPDMCHEVSENTQ